MSEDIVIRRRRRRRRKRTAPLLKILVVVLIAVLAMLFSLLFLTGRTGDAAPGASETVPLEENDKATIAVTGDILMHMPVIKTGLQASGSYNFDSIFQYLAPYASEADYAIANLETTLCGTGAGYAYSGYPAFNCPDAIVDGLRDAGFDMLLTANNHCYDTKEYGFLRTVQTIREHGLEVLGTRAAAEEPKYTVKEINGIKIGMVCFTYEGQPENPEAGAVYMNRVAMSPATAPLINSFLPGSLEPFYRQVQQCLEEMKQAGAEATMMFIHWGKEYLTAPEMEQRDIAQKLCDMGFDVIVGGHPHVIQPVELLTSRVDPEKKTVCLFSTGNAVSNQRIEEMDLKTGHTEDGLLFSATFARDDDGIVYLEDVNLLPTWVDLTTGDNPEYHIVPLDESRRALWQSLYGMDSETCEHAAKSYDRTMELTGDGMQKSKEYLAQQKLLRESAELAA